MIWIPHGHLLRLDPGYYRGFAFVHWTMTISGRRKGWLHRGFHARLIQILDRGAKDYAVVVPAYTLMPDHMHWLAVGLSDVSDQLLWSRAARRELNRLLSPFRLQKQAFDHVLTLDERSPGGFSKVVAYICENPVVEYLVEDSRDWEFTGAVVPELAGLDPRDPEFSDIWWGYMNAKMGPWR